MSIDLCASSDLPLKVFSETGSFDVCMYDRQGRFKASRPYSVGDYIQVLRTNWQDFLAGKEPCLLDHALSPEDFADATIHGLCCLPSSGKAEEFAVRENFFVFLAEHLEIISKRLPSHLVGRFCNNFEACLESHNLEKQMPNYGPE